MRLTAFCRVCSKEFRTTPNSCSRIICCGREVLLSSWYRVFPKKIGKTPFRLSGGFIKFYNIEPKDKVFENLKKNIKISKDNIPAATQLFTPDWIVRYMVENTLGKIWVEGHPDSTIKENWKYYVDDPKQEDSVQGKLAKI